MTDNTKKQVETEFDLTSRQGIFDHVATFLTKQGKPAYRSEDGIGKCLYRLGDCACAAGALMPDHDDLPDLRGSVLQSRVMPYLDDRIPMKTDADICFMRDLQRAHDNSCRALDDNDGWLSRWRGRMSEIAANYELDDRIVAVAA